MIHERPTPSREEILAVRPWAVFFPGDPIPDGILFSPFAGFYRELHTPANGSFFIGVRVQANGWWTCHQIKSPDEPTVKLYPVDPIAKERLGLQFDAQYTFAETAPVRPGSWYFSHGTDYHCPVPFALYPPTLLPFKRPSL